MRRSDQMGWDGLMSDTGMGSMVFAFGLKPFLLIPKLFFVNHIMLSLTAQSGLVRVGDVQEAVGVLALLVHLAHQCVTLQNIPAIHKEVQRVFLRESNSLSDDEAKLIGGEVAGSQVSKMEKKRVSDELARENTEWMD